MSKTQSLSDKVDPHRDDLEDLAESELPVAELADALLEVIEDE